MPTTPYNAVRFPDLTNAPNVPLDSGNIAADVDNKLIGRVATPTARTALASKYDGMVVYEISTKRYYRWDATASAWAYAGGAPPPITAVTVNSGWTAGTGFAPGCYKDASGLVTVVGGATNGGAYTPGAGSAPFTLPAGFWPSKDIATHVMVPVGSGFILGGVYAADGTIRVNYNNSVSVPAGTLHTVNFSFHPGFAGGALA